MSTSTYAILIGFPLLLVLELIYFRLAARFRIYDLPNHRSLHDRPIIRGGGIIFYLAYLLFCIIYQSFSIYLFIGLSLAALISFLDDIFTLPNRFRILFHFLGLGLVLIEAGVTDYSWVVLAVIFIVAVGAMNAYNFMDGINGITVAYSIVMMGTFFYLNQDLYFIEDGLLILQLLALAVFAIFNFRRRARCFAGDVGSVTMGFLLIFLTLLLIDATGEWIWILLFAVYGVDSVLTIIHRLFRGENIFKAHRLHLYQVINRYLGVPHLVLSSAYAVVQLAVNVILLRVWDTPARNQWIAAGSILFSLGVIYLVLKMWVMRKYSA